MKKVLSDSVLMCVEVKNVICDCVFRWGDLRKVVSDSVFVNCSCVSVMLYRFSPMFRE